MINEGKYNSFQSDDLHSQIHFDGLRCIEWFDLINHSINTINYTS